MEQAEKIYEFGLLLSGKLTLEEAQSLWDRLEEFFINFGAKVIKKSDLQRKKLAYPIKKEGEAYFGFFYFSFLPEKIKELQEKMKFFDKSLLRFLCLTPPPNFDKIMSGETPKRKVEKVKKIKEKKKAEKIDLEALEQKLEEIKELI